MVTAAFITLAVSTILCVIFFALHKLRPESFAFRASVLRLVSLDMEMKLPARASPPASITPEDGPP
jgi:hypothetical protein